MRKTTATLVLVCLITSGCAQITQSRFNPLNWFGRAQQVQTPTSPEDIRPLVRPGQLATVTDNRPLVSRVTGLRIDQTPDGAIVLARGVATGQGHHNVELVPTSINAGVLTLAFRAAPPTALSNGVQQISAAHVLTSSELSRIRQVTVQAAENAFTSRR